MNEQERQEQLEAERLFAALEAIDAGRDPNVDPRQDPQLDLLLTTTAALQETWRSAAPAPAFAARLRARVLDAMQPTERALVVQPAALTLYRRLRHQAARRRGILTPLLTAAAAAAVTFAIMLAAESDPTTTVVAPAVVSTAPVERFDDAPRPPLSEPYLLSDSLAGLTDHSVVAELQRIEAALKLIQERAETGRFVDASLLRVMTESTATMANIIETAPESVTEQTVITYLQASHSGQVVLSSVDAAEGDRGALAAARRAAEDGFKVASDYIVTAHLAAVAARAAEEAAAAEQ
jgi:hypothetical protein